MSVSLYYKDKLQGKIDNVPLGQPRKTFITNSLKPLLTWFSYDNFHVTIGEPPKEIKLFTSGKKTTGDHIKEYGTDYSVTTRNGKRNGKCKLGYVSDYDKIEEGLKFVRPWDEILKSEKYTHEETIGGAYTVFEKINRKEHKSLSLHDQVQKIVKVGTAEVFEHFENEDEPSRKRLSDVLLNKVRNILVTLIDLS